MTLEILRTDSAHADFLKLIALLDIDLAERYGELQKQYSSYNTVELIQDVVILYQDSVPVACGAFKAFAKDAVEIKRVFVQREYRRNGYARVVLRALEEAAKEKGYRYAVLETGIKQSEAILFYQKTGYCVIPNYPPYAGNENSI